MHLGVMRDLERRAFVMTINLKLRSYALPLSYQALSKILDSNEKPIYNAMVDTIMKNSTQEPLENQKLLDKQNVKSDSVSHHELLQGNRDVCNGESDWREVSVAALYRPNIGHFAPSIIGYFMTRDDWNEQTLLALKEKARADFLVGIQTDESECKYLFKHLDVIKGIIRYQPDDVEDVIVVVN